MSRNYLLFGAILLVALGFSLPAQAGNPWQGQGGGSPLDQLFQHLQRKHQEKKKQKETPPGQQPPAPQQPAPNQLPKSAAGPDLAIVKFEVVKGVAAKPGDSSILYRALVRNIGTQTHPGTNIVCEPVGKDAASLPLLQRKNQPWVPKLAPGQSHEFEGLLATVPMAKAFHGERFLLTLLTSDANSANNSKVATFLTLEENGALKTRINKGPIVNRPIIVKP